MVLAGLAFAVFSVALPLFLLYRIFRTPTAKLYDAMRTLLSLGPMYNIYAQGNQLYYGLRFLASLVTGITVGVGQEHGLAQAIVLLVVEIAFGIGTTIWHPWRAGAGMVIPGFLFAMIRILSAALLVVMAPSVSQSARSVFVGSVADICAVANSVPRYRLDSVCYSPIAGYRAAPLPIDASMQDRGRPHPALWQDSVRRVYSSIRRRGFRSFRWTVRKAQTQAKK